MSFLKFALCACVATLTVGSLQAVQEEPTFGKENELADCGCGKKRRNVEEEQLAGCGCPHLQNNEDHEALACNCVHPEETSFHHNNEDEHLFV